MKISINPYVTSRRGFKWHQYQAYCSTNKDKESEDFEGFKILSFTGNKTKQTHKTTKEKPQPYRKQRY